MDVDKTDSLGVRHVQARLTEKEFALVRAKVGSVRGAMQNFARNAVLLALAVPTADNRLEISSENERPHALLAELLASRERAFAVSFLEALYEAACDRRAVKGRLDK